MLEILSKPEVDVGVKKLILSDIEELMPQQTKVMQRLLAKLYTEVGDEEKAVANYKTAADWGDEPSTLRLARAFQSAELGVAKDEVKSQGYYIQLTLAFFGNTSSVH